MANEPHAARPAKRLAATPISACFAFLTLAALCATPPPVNAQMHIYVRENGKRVYVNADENNVPPSSRKPGQGGTSALSKAASRRTGDYSATPGVPQASREEIERLIQQTAERHNVDPALIRAVIAAESAYQPGATSRKGAQGLMQLMPGTAQELGVGNAYDPRQNIDAGARYLRALLEKYDGDLDKALAAYNAGEGAVARAHGVPNYAETRAYVRKVTNNYFHPGSGRQPNPFERARTIRREVDEKGRIVFTNE
jgi:soluble lytic murein transglycosylase-like protein